MLNKPVESTKSFKEANKKYSSRSFSVLNRSKDLTNKLTKSTNDPVFNSLLLSNIESGTMKNTSYIERNFCSNSDYSKSEKIQILIYSENVEEEHNKSPDKTIKNIVNTLSSIDNNIEYSKKNMMISIDTTSNSLVEFS